MVKKTAQKLILDLKDKLKLEDMTEVYTEQINGDVSTSSTVTNANEAVEALVALGYSNHEALMAVKGLSELGSVEAIIKEA